MDRFEWADGLLGPDENLVHQQGGVRLYDGEKKTSFDYGKLLLTTHRVIWRDHKDQSCVIAMALARIILLEEESAGWARSPKIVAHLSPPPPDKPPGPATSSPNHSIKLSFKDGGETEFYRCLSEEVAQKRWEQVFRPLSASAGAKPRQFRAGIVGIERHMQEKHKNTDKSITQAFEDLTQLMDKAKEMVNLSKKISAKIKDKQGGISEDETIKFKSYLLSLGISDPVTRETHGSGDRFYQELAKQVSSMLESHLKECGGMMTLSDVYCRVNRARGMELLSPEDLIGGCRLMDAMGLPVRLVVFESGVMVIQLQSQNDAQIIKQTEQEVEENGSLTADELSKLVGVSVILAKERLLTTERAGKACRDETVEGLRFYPNWFMTKPVS